MLGTVITKSDAAQVVSGTLVNDQVELTIKATIPVSRVQNIGNGLESSQRGPSEKVKRENQYSDRSSPEQERERRPNELKQIAYEPP